MKRIRHLGLLFLGAALVACDPGQPRGNSDIVVSDRAAPLEASEYSTLSPEEQYAVASKLLATIYKGIPAEEFFDLSSGDTSQPLQVRNPNFLADTRQALKTELGLVQRLSYDAAIDGIDDQGNPDPDVALYSFDSQRPRQIPLARIKEYPISRDMFVNWMAYFLSNTIMFSPATEMESTEIIDAQRVYRFLVNQIEQGASVRSIVRGNLPSLHRWRVSRSPENHALEAFELYLGLFETEEDSFRGGIACRDYYLTDAGRDYLIDVTDFPNITPQLILEDYYVTDCDDLYDVVASHPLLIPRVTEVILNYIMAGRDIDDKIAVIEDVVAGDPQTFDDIFLAILFSREFLIETERPKSFEENLFGMMDRLKWSIEQNANPVNRNIFKNMTSRSDSDLYIPDMGWASMTLKIGRLPEVPLDGLSFANYHKGIREGLMIRSAAYSGTGSRPAGLLYDDDGDVYPFIDQMNADSYIDFIFLTALQRKASEVEKTDLKAFFTFRDFLDTDPDTGEVVFKDSRLDDASSNMLDYISRLAEFYYLKGVSGTAGGAS